MKAVILAGGKGTRLRPLTCGTPKPIVPVLNRPLLEHTLRSLARQNVKEIVLALSYMPDEIKNVIGDGSELGIRLFYVHEEEALGTSGAVKNAERYLDEPFFVLNGDVLTNIDLGEMMRRHREVRPKATIALIPVDNPTLYGVVETDKRSMVTRFVEKPSWDKVTTNLINAGVYILEPEILRTVPPEAPSMFESYVFPILLAAKEPILAYPYNDYWIDIGTPEKYLKANHDLLQQRGKEVFFEGKSQIDPSAQLDPPVLVGDGCQIEAGAKIIGPTVLGPRCTIAEGVTLEHSVLWEGAKVGRGASLKLSVAGYRCRVEEQCHLEDCILGDYVVVGRGVWEWGARVPPKSIVPAKTRPEPNLADGEGV